MFCIRFTEKTYLKMISEQGIQRYLEMRTQLCEHGDRHVPLAFHVNSFESNHTSIVSSIFQAYCADVMDDLHAPRNDDRLLANAYNFLCADMELDAMRHFALRERIRNLRAIRGDKTEASHQPKEWLEELCREVLQCGQYLLDFKA